MSFLGRLGLLGALAAAGCASTQVTDRQAYDGEKVARPDRILVYHFAATPEEVPDDSVLAGQHEPPSQAHTPEEVAAARQLGVETANELAGLIDAMGIRSEAVPIGTPLPVGDLVIKGYLVSFDEGSEVQRLTIGFGKGASQLKTVVEGFQMTDQGLRKFGGGTVAAGGSETPGGVVGLAGLAATGNPAGLLVSTGIKLYGEESGSSTLEGRARDTAQEIAEQVEPRFREQGWIP